MWTLPTFPLLLCILTATFIRFAAATCANCTYNATGDADCSVLKTYLGCLENASGAGASCNLTAADALKIKNAKCTPSLPKACSCLKDLWGTNGTDDEKCSSLKTFIACLKVNFNDTSCTAGFNVSTLVASAKTRYADCKTTVCSSGPCKNGGRCNVTDNGGNYTCACTSGYSGRICNGGPCATFSCHDKGKCMADKKDKTKGVCVCKTGFTGDHCENGAPKEISLLSLLGTLLAANILRMTLT
ncbi:adhesive plaque matrix protein 2-like [Haliotis cracherodii]|uniref:adhesive plaque matrix protein 2-like n=1 Tax=Haliotis cracherodii TaxID=6455 RepID=UPI0039E881E1